jgi:hypothetical protein
MAESAEFQERFLQQQQVIDRLATEISQLEQLLNNLHLRNTGTPLNVQQAVAAIPTLKPFDHKNGDTSENIKSFRESWKDYCIASGLEHKPEREKIANLRLMLGVDTMKYFENLPLTLEDKSTAEKILDALQMNLVPELNVIYERAMFNSARQEEGESADDYVNRLRKLIKNCKYGELSDEFLRDRLVVSIKDRGLRRRFYENNKLTLANVVNQLKVSETAEQQLQEITPNEFRDVNRINNNFAPRNKSRSRSKSSSRYSKDPRPQGGQPCESCGYSRHAEGDRCPAASALCNHCHSKGHYAKVCRKRDNDQTSSSNQQQRYRNQPRRRNYNKNNTVNAMQTQNTEESVIQQEIVYSIGVSSSKVIESDLIFLVAGKTKQVKCQMDTGATCNVVGFDNYCQIVENNEPVLSHSSITIKCFGGSTVNPIGEAIINCRRNNKIFRLVFQVVEHTHQPLLSANACKRLGLIKICNTISEVQHKSAVDIVAAYSDVFDGLGKFSKPVSLEVDEHVKPVIDAPRRIPIAGRPIFEKTIAELEEQKLIEKVERHTSWVSNALLVNRDGKTRLCIDPVHLNRALKRVNYQIPTIDEILPELSKARVFTTLDAKKGFWQLELDEPSSYLTTFWGPSGQFAGYEYRSEFLQHPSCSSNASTQLFMV